MKKFMFAATVAAAMAGFAVESQIVGYGTKNNGSNNAPTWGNSFVSMTATEKGNFRLGDLKLEGSTWGRDWLGFIDPTTSIMDMSKNVTYYSAAEAIADGGSAEDAEWEDNNEVCKDDVEYPFGTAFLCNFTSQNVTMTYSGEVNADPLLAVVDCTGKSAPFVSNIYPGDLTFGQIKMTGSTWGRDWAGFVDPATSVVDMSRNITYYSEAEAIADGGSAEDAEWEDNNEICKDDVPLKMGEGFLGNFSSTGVKVIFPVYTSAK